MNFNSDQESENAMLRVAWKVFLMELVVIDNRKV